MKGKIFGETKQIIDEKLDLGWGPKKIVDYLRAEKSFQISSMAIIKYRRKRERSLQMANATTAISGGAAIPVINELRNIRHRWERILEEVEKTIAPATPTDADKLRKRIIDLYETEIDALKGIAKEEETDITLLFQKEAEREPDESKRDLRGIVLGLLRKTKRKTDTSLPEKNSEEPFQEEGNK